MKRLEDFDNEYLFVLPPEALEAYSQSPIMMNLYVTDLGFFPNAQDHYVSRKNGAAGWIIIFCTNGSGTVEVNDKKYPLHQHSLIILPPKIKHRYYAADNDPWDIYWAHFQGELASDYLNVYPNTAFFVDELGTAQAKSIMAMFWMMIKAFIPGMSYNSGMYVSQLLGAVLSSLSVNSIDNHHLITGSNYADLAIQYIYKHIKEPIKIGEIANSLDISTSYLSRIFREVVSVSVNQFITTTKMERASHYLQYTNVPIQQIATRLGYSDSYYFSRVFKKEYHVSPKTFRGHL